MGVSEHGRLQVAQERFSAFFAELRELFLERDDVLTQLALALLAREHVLMMGPPGTAKSSLASAVVRRIVDERTGEPSVFSKQLTESTVQTDLIGPIDFKTLTETGRTEHFTDEGMLGAIHAHLDEVLDGRDMLLRATLNVLHERELKQGLKVTRGQIECAIMTSNRYLAELLEGSRENLLAFVDRIAFLSFVPKGFADPDNLTKVLAAQVGTTSSLQPRQLLTIQDVDLLQDAVDRVHVPRALLAHLGQLLARFEEEIEVARRADPTFLPSRYLSTRTAVRLSKVLKATCVLHRCMDAPTRALEVRAEDFELIRLGLILSGPSPEGIEAILAREQDARERRQLSILQVEREIFDRVLLQTPLPVGLSKGTAVDVEGLESELSAAEESSSTGALADAAAKIATAAGTGLPRAEEAADLLRRSAEALVRKALHEGVVAGAAEPHAAPDQLSHLADELEAIGGDRRPLARWLRGRALDVISHLAVQGPARFAAAHHEPCDGVSEGRARANTAFAAMRAFDEQRWRLEAAGADAEEAPIAERWKRALRALDDEMARVFDEALAAEVEAVLPHVGADFRALLSALEPTFAALDEVQERLEQLGAKEPTAKTRVIGPRLMPALAATFEQLDTSDRPHVLAQTHELLGLLRDAGVAHALSAGDVLACAARALIRAETELPSDLDASEEGFRELRKVQQRIPVGICLVEIAGALSPTEQVPADPVAAMASRLAALPSETLSKVAAADLARVEVVLDHLDAWWAAVYLVEEDDGALLTRLTDEGFLEVAFGEEALLRFALESRLCGELFPDAAERSRALTKRARELHVRSAEWLRRARRARADARWNALSGSS